MPTIEEIINYQYITVDKLIYTYFTNDRAEMAELWWDGKEQQLRVVALIKSLEVTFDGKLSTPDIPRMNLDNPGAGEYLSFSAGEHFYFKQEAERTTDSRYSINQNHSFLELDDCTFNLADYSEGISFDLRCDFSGKPEDGIGYVKILSSIIQDNTV